jgi:hypothetical protein
VVTLTGTSLTAVAVAIFAVTLILVIAQPRGISIGWSAAGGAVVALLLGVVDLANVARVWDIVWNATITFVAVLVISLVLDHILSANVGIAAPKGIKPQLVGWREKERKRCPVIVLNTCLGPILRYVPLVRSTRLPTSSSWATLAATSDLVRPRTCLRPRLPVAGSVPKLTKPCQPSER